MWNFPDSPTAGQVFTTPNGAQYIFTDGVWKQASAAQIKLTAQDFNRVVNPAMQVSQEWDVTAGTSTGFYMADQWLTSQGGSSWTISWGRVASRTPRGSSYRLRGTVTLAKPALAAGDWAIMQQYIEGLRFADFLWGTANGKPAILRFGFRGPAGTYGVSIRNGPTVDRTWVGTFTIAAGQANIDTEQTFIVPPETVGTWATDNSRALQLCFCVAAGSGQHGVAGWQTGNFYTTSAQFNGLGANGNIFELFDVGLYLDPEGTGAAPPWQMPSFADAILDCWRYFRRLVAPTDVIYLYGYNVAGATETRQYPLSPPMRTTPAGSFGGSWTASNATGITVTGYPQVFSVMTSVIAQGAWVMNSMSNGVVVLNARM